MGYLAYVVFGSALIAWQLVKQWEELDEEE